MEIPAMTRFCTTMRRAVGQSHDGEACDEFDADDDSVGGLRRDV